MGFVEKPSRSSSTSQSPPPSFDAALYQPLASNPVEFLTKEKDGATDQDRDVIVPAGEGLPKYTTRNKS